LHFSLPLYRTGKKKNFTPLSLSMSRCFQIQVPGQLEGTAITARFLAVEQAV